MLKIQLIDMPPEQTGDIPGISVSRSYTLWNGGRNLITPEENTNAMFINANYGDHSSSSLHKGNSEQIIKYVENGGIVVVFLANCSQFHLDNLLGLPSFVRVRIKGGNSKGITVADSVFLPIFSIFGNQIISSVSLIERRLVHEKPKIELHPDLGSDNAELLAYQNDISSVVSLKYSLGKGFYLFLPFFGNTNSDVISLLMNDILPNRFQSLFEQPIEKWIKDENYKLSEIVEVEKKIKKLDEEYQEHQKALSDEYKEVWLNKQEPYLKLITSQGNELKDAVANFFREIGYYVIDVDEYMAQQGTENGLEEDLWLLDSEEKVFEKIMKRPDLKIVEVKGIKHTPKDEDITAISKYVRKRLRETKNPEIRGFFVVNHQMGVPAFERTTAFRKMLVENAQDAGELLVSTDQLFKVVKALKQGTLALNTIKESFDSTFGEYVFSENATENEEVTPSK